MALNDIGLISNHDKARKLQTVSKQRSSENTYVCVFRRPYILRSIRGAYF
ncbi:hypothetical protein MCC93_23730 [Morococcus cerebrosus]|uniref:Uncharacterized protein n=1 Tax=Morococcus cerebrosus TaxID=1056807 RepID=A0A0C1GHY7_9NEIS|nr:hypothetical protein MCC93_23730 [Morococcus cerebrosus]